MKRPMADPTTTHIHVLKKATYRHLIDSPPQLAVLPWGATEAHNYHLPHGTDIFEAESIAEEAARLAYERGDRPVVLPCIPFGNNAQQQDQAATIHLSTPVAYGLLKDIAASLTRQNIDKLLLVNGHGGNEFKPLVRDIMLEFPIVILVVDFWKIRLDAMAEIFSDPGDHAGDLETSLMLHLQPELVHMEAAGRGNRRPFGFSSMGPCGAWTPRPWSQVHPDTGSGNPKGATAEKGAVYFQRVTKELSQLITDFIASSDITSA